VCLNQFIKTSWMIIWCDTPVSQQQTCWTTSLRLKGKLLLLTSRSILNTCTRLGILNSQLRLSSSRFKIVLTILKQGESSLGTRNKSTLGMQKIFSTGHFMSACRWWNEKLTIKKIWTQFKSHVAAAHRQHKHMQG
jgi:hypothetical protein